MAPTIAMTKLSRLVLCGLGVAVGVGFLGYKTGLLGFLWPV